MDDRPDDTPREDGDIGLPEDKRVTPDPHRGEPLPPPEEGMRPEAENLGPRPEQEEHERVSPAAALFSAEATDVKARYTGDVEAEAEAERLGVEGEGVASGQILGLMAATIVAVLVAVIAVFYLTSIQASSAVEAGESGVTESADARALRVEAEAKLSYRRSSGDSTGYSVPIERAMELVLADYATRQAGQAGLVEAPETRQDFNAAATNYGRARAEGVQPLEANQLGAPPVPASRALRGTEPPETPTEAVPLEEAVEAPAEPPVGPEDGGTEAEGAASGQET